jgi:uncharacterized membrane protein
MLPGPRQDPKTGQEPNSGAIVNIIKLLFKSIRIMLLLVAIIIIAVVVGPARLGGLLCSYFSLGL